MKRYLPLVIVPVFAGFTACSGGKEEAPAPAPASPAAPVAANASASAANGSAPVADAGGKRYGIKGTIKYTGKVPTDTVKMSADQVCAKAHSTAPVQQYTLQTGPGGGLKNAVVTIREGASLPRGPESLSPAVLDQKGCLYTPHILVVQVNQPVSILNSDPTMHNVNAQSKTGQGFNAGMPTAGGKIEKKFTKPEIVKLKCDVHGWMSAYIAVMNHQYYAVTGESGEFKMSELPPGKYNLEIWHEKLGTKTQLVEVTDKDAEVAIAFP